MESSMELVMETYAAEMQRPLRNFVSGQLVTTLGIQVGGWPAGAGWWVGGWGEGLLAHEMRCLVQSLGIVQIP
jgi:hypothetical protein